MTKLTGNRITQLMRANKHTIRSLAKAMNVAQTRVRYVREHGVTGSLFVKDWLEFLA